MKSLPRKWKTPKQDKRQLSPFDCVTFDGDVVSFSECLLPRHWRSCCCAPLFLFLPVLRSPFQWGFPVFCGANKRHLISHKRTTELRKRRHASQEKKERETHGKRKKEEYKSEATLDQSQQRCSSFQQSSSSSSRSPPASLVSLDRHDDVTLAVSRFY